MSKHPLHMGRPRISKREIEPRRLTLQESLAPSEMEWLRAENACLKWVVVGLQEQLEQALEVKNEKTGDRKFKEVLDKSSILGSKRDRVM